MTKQPRIPESETSKSLLTNLRRSRLELDEINLQLTEISARLELELREQKMKRIQQTLANLSLS